MTWKCALYLGRVSVGEITGEEDDKEALGKRKGMHAPAKGQAFLITLSSSHWKEICDCAKNVYQCVSKVSGAILRH